MRGAGVWRHGVDGCDVLGRGDRRRGSVRGGPARKASAFLSWSRGLMVDRGGRGTIVASVPPSQWPRQRDGVPCALPLLPVLRARSCGVQGAAALTSDPMQGPEQPRPCGPPRPGVQRADGDDKHVRRGARCRCAGRAHLGLLPCLHKLGQAATALQIQDYTAWTEGRDLQ